MRYPTVIILTVILLSVLCNPDYAHTMQATVVIEHTAVPVWIDDENYFELLPAGHLKAGTLRGDGIVLADVDKTLTMVTELAFRATKYRPNPYILSLRLSPDAKSAVASSCSTHIGTDTIHLTATTGAYSALPSHNLSAYPEWTPDSTRVAVLDFSTEGTYVNWFRLGKKSTSVFVSDLRLPKPMPSGCVFSFNGISMHGTGVILKWTLESHNPLTVYEADISQGKQKTRSRVIKLPIDRIVNEIAFNARSGQLALLCYAEFKNQLKSGEMPHATSEIWTCGMDGTAMEKQWSSPTDIREPGAHFSTGEAQYITWMPSGKYISFLKEAQVWKLPIKLAVLR